MRPQNNIALKEWAIVLEALEEAKQSVLLRKGGVEERPNGFEVKHKEFFLYPTLEHESPENIKADWRPRLAGVEKNLKSDPKHVKFRLYAQVEEVHFIADWEVCRRVLPFAIYSDAYVEKRFHSGEKPGIFVLVPRIFILPVPMDLLIKPSYGGCKSWVELETALFTVGSIPVVPDTLWNNTLQRIRKVLGTAENPSA